MLHLHRFEITRGSPFATRSPTSTKIRSDLSRHGGVGRVIGCRARAGPVRLTAAARSRRRGESPRARRLTANGTRDEPLAERDLRPSGVRRDELETASDPRLEGGDPARAILLERQAPHFGRPHRDDFLSFISGEPLPGVLSGRRARRGDDSSPSTSPAPCSSATRRRIERIALAAPVQDRREADDPPPMLATTSAVSRVDLPVVTTSSTITARVSPCGMQETTPQRHRSVFPLGEDHRDPRACATV